MIGNGFRDSQWAAKPALQLTDFLQKLILRSDLSLRERFLVFESVNCGFELLGLVLLKECPDASRD